MSKRILTKPLFTTYSIKIFYRECCFAKFTIQLNLIPTNYLRNVKFIVFFFFNWNRFKRSEIDFEFRQKHYLPLSLFLNTHSLFFLSLSHTQSVLHTYLILQLSLSSIFIRKLHFLPFHTHTHYHELSLSLSLFPSP